MSTQSGITCESRTQTLERVRYYPRQLIDANTLTTDQDYEREKLRRHNRMMHGWGVVCGLDVKPNPNDKQPLRITVCPGYALAPQGDAIDIQAEVNFDLATGVQTSSDPCASAAPCPPVGKASADGDERFLYLAARYTECYSRPERVPPAGCGCDESACEYARIRDGFELKLLQALPESHRRADAADEAWCEQVKRWSRSDKPGPAPAPPCSECTDDPWVVLARIRIPEKAGTVIDEQHISYQGRRVLYSVSALQTVVGCI